MSETDRFKSARPETLDDAQLAARVELAIAIGKETAELVRGYFRSDSLLVETKPDSSPVTEADREGEMLLRRRIEEQYPGDTILGEEFGEKEGDSDRGFRWILDPIDGTKSFVHGVPLFGSLIGIEFGGVAVGGLLFLPALDEYLYASKGQGAWYVREGKAPEPARVSQLSRLEDGLFCTTASTGFDSVGRADTYERLRRTAAVTRGWGDCYAYALVATGRAELAIDPLMHLWDNAALAPIIEEAGGCFTDWDGVPTIFSPNAVASNGRVHEQSLELLRAT